MTDKPLIGITMGDPSGIGSEVIAKALQRADLHDGASLFVIGSLGVMQSALDLIGAGMQARAIDTPEAAPGPGAAPVLDDGRFADVDFPTGQLSVASAKAAHSWIETAARLCLDRRIGAMVTAPVNKEAFHMAGIEDTGHQEVFARMTGSDYVATMLVSGELRCMHLSTHKSLKVACEYVTRQNVLRAIRLTDRHFRDWGFDNPRIAVAALNPHASDNGLIGREELDEIAPAIQDAAAEGINASGPVPADSVFNQAINGRWDVVLVMYHDQGHIAIKVHGFEESISVNLGIPFIRTSVDHGTAFDIAGKGRADETSMVEAIKLATMLATGSALAPQPVS